MPAHAPPHPSPHRHRVPVVLVFAGFLTGPIAWALAMMASYGFASHWCFPGSQRLTGPMVGWGGVSVLIPVLYIAAIVVTAAAAAISYRTWSITRTEAAGHALDIGEGRTRFLAAWGLMTSATFIVLLGFNLINTFLVPPCAT
jgi:hypothetical protein